MEVLPLALRPALNAERTLKQAAGAFSRYGFRGLLVTDASEIIPGVVLTATQ